MTAARIKPASNFTLQRTGGSRCSPPAAERARWADERVRQSSGRLPEGRTVDMARARRFSPACHAETLRLRMTPWILPAVNKAIE
jgi:hypothetical protein